MGKPRSGIQVSIYNTPGNEQRRPTSCARVITRDTKRMNDICEYISECSSVTSADIKGVLEALTSYIGRELSYGYSVELEGLGHFSPSVKSKEVTDQKGNTKSSASIHGVNFRCSPRLKEMVKKNAPILVKRENLPKTGIEGRKAKMLSYLERNSYINLTDYVNPAKRNAIAVKNEMRFSLQKRNVLQKSRLQSFRLSYPVEIQVSFKRLLKTI